MGTIGVVLSSILPVFVVAGSGFAVRRLHRLDMKTLSTLNLYLFIPSLVFSSLFERQLEWGVFGRIAAGCCLMTLSMGCMLALLARWRRIEGEDRSAFLMTMFMNLGNFGLPVCKFAFGDDGLALAVVVMVCGSFLQNSVGLYFAQRSRLGMASSFLKVFCYPLVYAFVLALACQKTGWAPPLLLSRAIDILGGAAIPIQLIILGAQLAETRPDLKFDVCLAAAMRLCTGPALAVALLFLVGLEGLPGKVFILQMSGPIAVGMAAFGVQFDVAPRFLASAVCLSSLLSVITVSAILYLLMMT